MVDRDRLLPLALAALAGIVVFTLAWEVFPYHSSNHDEGVYLQQAAMLLEGQLFLYPPVEDAFRPWFFVDAGEKLYPKYAPVSAAMFAVGKLLGGYRLTLALIAAGNVGLTYLIAREVFDHRTGLLAGVFLLASPLFLVESSVFLPYAPTAFWNLVFAFTYFRAERTHSVRWAAISGASIGIAFFSRPYTSVLFALPFIAHALYSLRGIDYRALDLPLVDQALRTGKPLSHPLLRRRTATAVLGLVGVIVTLGYNWVVTGHPFLFPYQAFAPLDGLGFGHREILGHERNYTPELALRANARVLRTLFVKWVVAGPFGTLLAALGVGVAVARSLDWRRAVLAGLFISIPLGNVYFWGNLNILGVLTEPNDGLIRTLGPYYHFDLLLPTAAFAAVGAQALAARTLRALHTHLGSRYSTAQVRAVGITALLVGSLILGGLGAAYAAEPLRENAEVTAEYDAAYQPFEERDFENAVVFLPTPYGDWLNHPFQALRNDPGYDGDTVYALPENQFEVVEAFPNREYYRYGFRGEWLPYDGRPVTPTIQRVHAVQGERVITTLSIGVPDYAASVSVRLSSDADATYYALNATPGQRQVDLVVANGSARLQGAEPIENESIPVDDSDEVEAEIFVDTRHGTGFSYHAALPVERTGEDTRALTPYLELCRVPRHCGGEAAYVESEAPAGTSLAVDLRAENETIQAKNKTRL